MLLPSLLLCHGGISKLLLADCSRNIAPVRLYGEISGIRREYIVRRSLSVAPLVSFSPSGACDFSRSAA